ncbi:endolytic transglycosylase MltG [Legionella londiniensis]|uniref:Endolytic murein transglycosylase n=1 Tax=Legionella londiniensis TaxID=45068 RepID=A0A0W0VKL1_9GAMM|nr:endolytic transglycosylase MltG [Legionella londiniensis]KTD20631.1 periplasmic solute-binding protein [Legionella londiniensis]STX92898.1 putative periplasmic solute-binding protein [Legionella londiniensis]
MKRCWLKYFIISSVTLLIILMALGIHAIAWLYQPMLAERAAPIVFSVDKNTSAASFVHRLKNHGLIQSEFLYLSLIRLQGLSQSLKAGIYQIMPKESAMQFLARVAAGDVLIESFTIIEGTTQFQVEKNLKAAEYLTYAEQDWDIIAKDYPSSEGLLLADTYHYQAGSQSIDLILQAHANLKRFLNDAWENRSPGLPYKSPYELLITASILEKETALPHEKKLIAGVIVNRLRKNMPLQMDPTVIYAMGSNFHGKLTREHLQVDSPYNTYRNRGLPPAPIAMVGKEAIFAAAHPDTTNYLYFVAKGDGSHHFSATYDEQKKAIARYRKNYDINF